MDQSSFSTKVRFALLINNTHSYVKKTFACGCPLVSKQVHNEISILPRLTKGSFHNFRTTMIYWFYFNKRPFLRRLPLSEAIIFWPNKLIAKSITTSSVFQFSLSFLALNVKCSRFIMQRNFYDSLSYPLQYV